MSQLLRHALEIEAISFNGSPEPTASGGLRSKRTQTPSACR